MVKFLVDVMLQKLGRWLRIIGVPTEMPEHEDDNSILEQARRRGLTLLTRDRVLAERAEKLNIKIFALPRQETDTESQLKLVIKKFKLKTKGFEKRTLCTKCSGKLEFIGRNIVKGKIPKDVLLRFRYFLRCKSCSQIYWEGSHWRKINERMKRIDEKKK
ncbi:MAG: Mut7-C RNAse domain-containing protein [Candidatus Micrarchaeia archaeon]